MLAVIKFDCVGYIVDIVLLLFNDMVQCVGGISRVRDVGGRLLLGKTVQLRML